MKMKVGLEPFNNDSAFLFIYLFMYLFLNNSLQLLVLSHQSSQTFRCLVTCTQFLVLLNIIYLLALSMVF